MFERFTLAVVSSELEFGIERIQGADCVPPNFFGEYGLQDPDGDWSLQATYHQHQGCHDDFLHIWALLHKASGRALVD